MTCVPSEQSDQPGHPPSQIRVFAVRMKNHWALNYQLSTQWRLWSDWMDTQADLSLWWAQMSFSWFCRATAQFEPSHKKRALSTVWLALLSSGARSPSLCVKLPLAPYIVSASSKSLLQAGSPEPLLSAYVISNLSIWVGSIDPRHQKTCLRGLRPG